MNELMVDLGSAGWLYYRTTATSVGSALKELSVVLESNGINVDNIVNFSSAVLRSSSGDDIDLLGD